MITDLEYFVVYDTKAEADVQLFAVKTVAIAKRSFSDLLNDPSTTLYHHPEDFTLYHIGTFTCNPTSMISLERVCLGNGVDFKKPVSDSNPSLDFTFNNKV